MLRLTVPLLAALLAALACALLPALPTATPAPPAESLPPRTEVAPPTAITLPTAPLPPALATAPPIPEAPLANDQPWVLIRTLDQGLWGANPDGSGLTQLVGPASFGPLAVAPQGRRLAYITSNAGDSLTGLQLHIWTLPAGAKTVLALTSESTAVQPGDEFGDDTFQIAQAITHEGSLGWSPDGLHLAFIGAMNSASADLYLYSVEDGSVAQLTDGPSQAYRLSWSPDGQYIVHAGAEGFGTGAGYVMAGVWAARADNTEVKTLYKPDSGDEVFLGWTSPDTFLVYSFRVQCSTGNLRARTIPSGRETALWPGYFDQGNIAADPASGSAIFTVDEFVADCNEGGQQGAFIIPAGGEPIGPLDAPMGRVAWNPGLNLFSIASPEGIQFFTWDGWPADPPGDQAAVENMYQGSRHAPLWTEDGQAAIAAAEVGLVIARAPEYREAVITSELVVADYPYPFAWLRP
jgi:hypothetical protein